MLNNRSCYWVCSLSTIVLTICVLLLFSDYDAFAQDVIYLPVVANNSNGTQPTPSATMQPTATFTPTPTSTPTYTPTATGEILFDNFPVPSDIDFSTTTSWEDRNITYFFASGTEDIAGDDEYQAVRDAFDIWAGESSLVFTEVDADADADIVISWQNSNDHGDNCSFKEDGTTLAHAFYPPPETYCNVQSIHFNDQKEWMIAQDTDLSDNIFDVLAVALHEIGHAIGLLHNDDSDSIVMYPGYGGHRRLNADDIQGIRSLYPVEKRIFNETSEVGPTLYNFGIPRIGWIGSGNQRLNFADSPSGNNKITLSETGIRGITTAVFNGELYVAWSGTDGAHRINLMRSSDGETFRDKVIFTDTSISAPALVVFNNQLYLGWTGTDANHRLNLMRSNDGQMFGDKVVLNETSHAGVTLEVYNNDLYIGWTGDDETHRLNLMRSADGQSFKDKVTLNDMSMVAPSLVAYNNQLYIAWTGVNETQNLNIMRSMDGLNYSHKIILDETSISAPSLIVSGNELHIGWTGTDEAHRINDMVLDFTSN